MSGLQPTSLSNEELLKYAFIENNSGLPKDWCDVLITRFDDVLEELEFLKKELDTQENLVAELEDEVAVLRNR